MDCITDFGVDSSSQLQHGQTDTGRDKLTDATESPIHATALDVGLGNYDISILMLQMTGA